MIKVSVAVITYNMANYLPALLDSIFSQKVDFEYEIVINDDCSPDNSREIIRGYQLRYPGIIRTAYLESNVGGSRNMFEVLNRCKGEYIALLEGDDWWEDESKLQYQFDFMVEHPEYIGMCCNSWCDHGLEPEYDQKMRNRTEPKIFTFDDFMARHFHDRLPSSTDTWFFRNFLRDGGDYSLMYKAHTMVWDQSLALILLCKGSVYADPKVVSHHRSVVRADGQNYQSLIKKKNPYYGDSRMYQAMEEYIRDQGREVGAFRLVRGDTWIDAYFTGLKTRRKTDRDVARAIWRDQPDKAMLLKLFVHKALDIVSGKLSK